MTKPKLKIGRTYRYKAKWNPESEATHLIIEILGYSNNWYHVKLIRTVGGKFTRYIDGNDYQFSRKPCDECCTELTKMGQLLYA